VSLVENVPPPSGEEPAPDASFRAGPIITISAGHAAHDTYIGFLPILLPSFVERFGLSNTKAGALSAFTQLPSLLQPVFGHLADRLALRWMVTLFPGVTATLMSLTGWAPAYAVLALLLTAAGVSSAAFHAVASATAGRLSARHLGRGMSVWMVGGELGSALGPLLAAGALAVLTIKELAWLMLLGWAASLFLHLQLRRLPACFGNLERPHWRLALGRMRRVMGIVSALAVLRAMALSAPWTFGPILLQEEGHGGLASGAALTLYLTAGMVGTLAAGWLSDRVGRRLILLLGSVIGPAGLLLFIAVGGWSRFIFLAVAGAATVALHPVCMALVQGTFPENRGLANALYLSTVFVVSSASAVAVGALGDAIGLRTAFVVSGAVTFLSIPLIFLLPPDRKALRKR
jgi:FSR family fosmidomycin resistance protein-like MFS transporter